MTIAGMNVAFRVWRITTPSDDYAGGALISGSVVYEYMPARFEAQPATQQFLEQGLEVVHLFKATNISGNFLLYERDELELIQPTDHWEYGKFFRIVDVHRSNHTPRDPRNFSMLTLTRSERAHSNDFNQ